MNKNDTKKGILFIIVVIIVVGIIGVLSFFILDYGKKEEGETVIKNVNEIKGYGINLRENATDAYKVEFENLKKNLESDNIKYDEYAESIAKMFMMDLYSLDNKINKYDVGGVEFVYPSVKDNYILNVTNTIYNYLEDNNKGNRKQSLPLVNSAKILETKKGTYTINETKEKLDSYTFTVEIGYKYDLGYDKTGEVIVVKKDKFMYVVEKN